MCGDILGTDFAARLARAIPRVCDRACDRALCVRAYDRACDRARDLTSLVSRLVSRSGAASPGGRLGASRQARQGRGSTPRGARARGSGLGCFATSGTGPLARVWGGVSGLVWGGLGRAPRGVLDRLWRGVETRRDGVWCGVCGVVRRGVVWCDEPGCGAPSRVSRRFVEKSMYQKRYKNGRLAAVFDAIFV